MVHPTKDELKLFISNKLADPARVQSFETHLAGCEFCREYCDLQRQDLALLAEADSFQTTAADREYAERLFRQAMLGKVITLNLMPMPLHPAQAHLAADGVDKTTQAVTNLATLFSEEPELVLRVMRDSEKDFDYVQLIGADPELTAHAMIRIPEISREYVTDAFGKAVVPRGDLGDLEKLRWEIKLPDARFDLKPLAYDPEKIESTQEVVLETEQHDRIQITFASKTAGKQILIRVLELDGETDFGSVRISISQQQVQELKAITPRQVVPFALVDPNQGINIRLYR
jgi:hypothetical protein